MQEATAGLVIVGVGEVVAHAGQFLVAVGL